MTLTEYIRRRRLTLAAQDLQHSKTPIIDIAIKYRYDSATAFSRAFAKQHGITPSVYRKDGGSLKVYSPASFHIMIVNCKTLFCNWFHRTDAVRWLPLVALTVSFQAAKPLERRNLFLYRPLGDERLAIYNRLFTL